MKEAKVNNEIDSNRVLLINEDGEKLGEFLTRDAVSKAREEGLDLVQVGNGSVPACKMMDYKRFIYDLKKKQKEDRKKSSNTKVKEIQLSPNTDIGDLKTKAKAADKFLSKGHKVSINLRAKGRQSAHRDVMLDKIDEFCDLITKDFEIEKDAVFSGKSCQMVLSPNIS